MSLKESLELYGNVLENEPLSKHTSYKIGGPADYFVEPDRLESIKPILDLFHEAGLRPLVLGNGSNVLVGDGKLHAGVIHLGKAFSEYEIDENNVLTAGAGCSLITLAFETMQKSLSGLEFASGIPGCVGGGLYMNAGAYRSDLSSILKEVYIYRDGRLEWIPKEELEYAYRKSAFQNHKDWVILAARFQLEPGNREEISALISNRKQRRLDSQPVDKPCAGSVFRNPDGFNAWKIVEDLGYRGKKCGGAQVSSKHCNFIINADGNAKAKDVLNLITQIQKDAREKFGIELITEVERIETDEEA